MNPVDTYLAANRALWNAWTPHHVTSQFYDVAAFKAGRDTLQIADLERWGEVIAHFLAPGGTFFIIEAHPTLLLFDDQRDDEELRLRYPYFNQTEPISEVHRGSYAVPDAPTEGVAYYWLHGLREIFSALLRVGLRLESFEEYRFMRWAYFRWMEQTAGGSWQLPPGKPDLPLMFSLEATKR